MRTAHQLVGREDIHDAATGTIRLDKIIELKRRFAKKMATALLLQRKQVALDGANARGGNVSILCLKIRGVFAHVLQDSPQVFHVEQQQSLIVGDLEHQVEHAL